MKKTAIVFTRYFKYLFEIWKCFRLTFNSTASLYPKRVEEGGYFALKKTCHKNSVEIA